MANQKVNEITRNHDDANQLRSLPTLLSLRHITSKVGRLAGSYSPAGLPMYWLPVTKSFSADPRSTR